MTEPRPTPTDAAGAERLTLAGRWLRWVFGPRLAWQFSIPSLVILLLVGIGAGLAVTTYMSAEIENDAMQEMTRDAERHASELADHFSADGLAIPNLPAQYEDFDRVVRHHAGGAAVVRINIWSQTGEILYSDEASLVGQTFPVEGELAEALEGTSAAEVSDLKAEENIAERDYGRLLEVYTPIRLRDSPEVLAVLGIYEDYAPVAARIATSQRAVYLAVGIGLAAIYVALVIVHRRGAVIIGRQRDRLLYQSEELKESYHATLDALGSALDLRDHATEGHCQRVSELATTLAQELGLSGKELEDIGRAATVHDIGKMALPDAILSKPGPLTDEEWREMRRHPELGYEMLKNIPVLREAAEIAYTHQEKYDGTGYPRGLKGEEIPLGARIFAVVDAYDAITTHRPYRKAASHEQAMEEIVHCAGTQFDPEVVWAFCKAEKKGLVRAPHPQRRGDGSRPRARKIVATVSRR